MRLRLNLCDVDMQLKINHWRKPYPKLFDCDNWTATELSLRSPYINYNINSEILLSDEVTNFCHVLGQLLAGEIQEDMMIDFIEPDLNFRLRPAKRLYSVPGEVWIKDGYKDIDIDMDMIINFWCMDGLGTNQFSMTFDRKEIEAMHTYLQIVIGELKIADKRVEELLNKGMILPE